MELDDATLIRRFQQGDSRALDLHVKRYEAVAFQYAYRFTKDSDKACDVVGDAFVRICRSLHGFKSECSFKTWLYRIVMNCYLDMNKRMKTRDAYSLESILETCGCVVEPLIIDEQPRLLEHVHRREREERLLQAIDTLPESFREIIVMFYLEMMSHEEIMKELGIPLGTVKSRLNRARLALKDALSDDIELMVAA